MQQALKKRKYGEGPVYNAKRDSERKEQFKRKKAKARRKTKAKEKGETTNTPGIVHAMQTQSWPAGVEYKELCR